MRIGFLLPLLFAVLAWDIFRRVTPGRREAALYAAAATGVYLVLLTELLSAFHALGFAGTAMGWALGCVVLFFARSKSGPLPTAPPWLAGLDTDDLVNRVLLILTGLVMATTAVIAFLAVPNSYDSLTYHLARVAHWAQDQSVGTFATRCLYQNQHAPWAEWAMLHLVVLQGNDHLVTFVQWLGYLGSIVAASLIAEKLGGSKRAALVAAFLAATVPMAILQSGSTQNDAVLGFWLLCAAYGCLLLRENGRWPRVLFFAASLGLALLTKAIAYLYAPAFCLWATITLLRRGWGPALPRLALVTLIVVTLNSGYVLRNWTWTGTLLGQSHDSGPGYSYENELHTPGALASNILRNLSLETPQLGDLPRHVQDSVVWLHRFLPVGPSDQRLTTYAIDYYVPPAADETQAASPVHLLAIVAVFGLLFFTRRKFPPGIRPFALCILAGALLFCFYLKWQPYHSRFHLPLFLLAAPVVAVVFDILRLRFGLMILAGLALGAAMPSLLQSAYHPLLGPESIFTLAAPEQRFTVRRGALPENQETLQRLHDARVRQLGIIGAIDNSGFEYPLFDPDNQHGAYPWRVEQVQVQNCYAPLETSEPLDAVVVFWPGDELTVEVHGRTFHRVLRGKATALFMP